MTSSYTLHAAPYAQAGDPLALDDATLVRDGFSWGAFLLAPIWYLAHRHWLAAFISYCVLIAVGAALAAAGLGPGAIMTALTLLCLLHGFEGPSVRRWLYERRGRPAVDVVRADTIDEAEVKSFERWLAAPPPPSIATTLAGFRREPAPVIGLFPDAEGRR